METALVRQPSAGPARPRAGRALRMALSLAGAGLAGSVVLLQPFTASHLFPGRTVTAPSVPAPAALSGIQPAAVQPAGEPLRLMPGGTLTRGPAASGRAAVAPQSAVAVAPAPAAEPVAQTAATEPAPQTATAQPGPAAEPTPQTPAARPPADAAQRDPRSAPALAGSVPLIPPAKLPPAALSPATFSVAPLGAPPPPREPLPLETDLIAQGSPVGSPGASAVARPTPVPAGGVQPAAKPAATDRHG